MLKRSMATPLLPTDMPPHHQCNHGRQCIQVTATMLVMCVFFYGFASSHSAIETSSVRNMSQSIQAVAMGVHSHRNSSPPITWRLASARGAVPPDGNRTKSTDRGSDFHKISSWIASIVVSMVGCGLTIAAIRKYALFLKMWIRWNTCPLRFQRAAMANGLTFDTYFKMLAMQGINTVEDLVLTTERMLDRIARRQPSEEDTPPMQITKLKLWRRVSEPAVLKATSYKYAPGLVDLKEYYDPASRPEGGIYTILLVGQTGKGKTAFLNLMYALDMVIGDLSNPALTAFKDKAIAQEGQQNMYSMTSKCTTYTIHIGPITLNIIDSPGFGDTGGYQHDALHEADIVSEIGRCGKISCVLVILSAADSRIAPEMMLSLRTIAAFMPRDAMETFAFLCTNCPSEESKSFQDASLSDLFPSSQKPKVLWIDNPHAVLGKKFPKGTMADSAQTIRGLSPTVIVREGIDAVVGLLDCIKMYTGIYTTRFTAVKRDKDAAERTLDQKCCKADSLAREVEEHKAKLEMPEVYFSLLPHAVCMHCGWQKAFKFVLLICPRCQSGMWWGFMSAGRPSAMTRMVRQRAAERDLQPIRSEIQQLTTELSTHLDDYQKLNLPGAYSQLLRAQKAHFDGLPETEEVQQIKKIVTDRLSTVQTHPAVQRAEEEALKLLEEQMASCDQVASESVPGRRSILSSAIARIRPRFLGSQSLVAESIATTC